MANTKISALSALTGANLATNDELAIVDTSATSTKKITIAELLVGMQQYGVPIVRRLTSQHSISATAATEITDLEVVSLATGTYVFTYSLIVRSATATVSPMYAVNFTGTAAVRKMRLLINDAGPLTAGTGQLQPVGSTATTPVSGMQVTAFATTAPNMGHTGGIASTATDSFVTIDGIMIVTASGNLEFWHGSETATATSVEVGSSLVVIKTA